jgi:hypothetical protein
VGLLKFLVEDLSKRSGSSADEEQRKREDRAAYKAMSTVLMTLVECLVVTGDMQPRGGLPGNNGESAIVAYLREPLDKKEPAEAKRRLEGAEQALCEGWAAPGVQAVVLLAWGALLRDAGLARGVHSVLGVPLQDKRRLVLGRAMDLGVFGFLEGALLSCWRRRASTHDDLAIFFVDVMVDLLGVYLNDPHLHLAQGHLGQPAATPRRHTPGPFVSASPILMGCFVLLHQGPAASSSTLRCVCMHGLWLTRRCVLPCRTRSGPWRPRSRTGRS